MSDRKIDLDELLSFPEDREPINIFRGPEALDELGALWEQTGDRGLILKGLYVVTKHNVPVPQWLRMAFQGAFLAVHLNKARGWDDVFGTPHKGRRLEDRQNLQELFFDIPVAVLERLRKDPRPSVNKEFFEELADRLGYPVRTVLDAYYHSSFYRELIKEK